MSNAQPYVERIDTSLGLLELDEYYSPQKLEAELRGMELLCSIVNATPVWSFKYGSDRAFLISNDDGPTILIDIFHCIQRRLNDDDPHLTVYMDQAPICVLRDPKSSQTPSTDSIVSLVLLGVAGWPLQATPGTLAQKARQTTNKLFEDCSELLPSDYEEIHTMIDINELGLVHEAISRLAEMARRWYVCRCWDIEKVKETLVPLLENFTIEEIEKYLEQPNDASDALFITI